MPEHTWRNLTQWYVVRSRHASTQNVLELPHIYEDGTIARVKRQGGAQTDPTDFIRATPISSKHNLVRTAK